MKKIILSALTLAAINFAAYAGGYEGETGKTTTNKSPKTEAKETTSEQIYDLKESPSGSILFSGTELEVEEYNDANYAQCDGNGANCTYVYEQGTSNRNTALERKHD